MDSKIKFSKNFEKFFLFLIMIFILLPIVKAADPYGPDILNITSNTTRTGAGAKIINISGGYIALINLTATVQDVRWKGFVGYISGSLILSDGSGSKIYDWSLSSITGRVYTTRNSTSVSWSNINCSNITTLNQENVNMNHANANDNLNKTFNYSSGATHNSFYVGTKLIPSDYCPTLNTYVNNATQDNYFQEMALYDGYNMVYATIMEPRRTGYSGQSFDFQMIVPENGASGYSSSTAYYLYVELGT